MAGMFHVVFILFLGVILLTSTAHGQQELKYSVPEEENTNKNLVNLVEDTDIKETVSVADIARLSFTIDSVTPQSANSMFFLDNSKGTLSILGTIDREVVCPRLESCVITLEISVNPIQYFRIFTVSVTVIDKNDNEPVFKEKIITKYISEATQPSPSASFSLPLAEDADSPRFGVTSYRIEPSTAVFSLVQNQVEGEITGINLVLNEKLDREIKSFYNLKVVAMNGGERPVSNEGILSVNVEVLDINDNKPKFENSTYAISLFEDVAVGVTFLILHAEDPDHGNNGRITYELDQSRSSDNIFSINSTTGELFLSSKLNREKMNKHRLYVTAKDNGPEALTDQAVVYITILDVNDNEPFIKVHGLSGLEENSEKGTAVAHISVSDPDVGENGQFRCSSDSDFFTLEIVSSGEYRLKTSQELDAEEYQVVTVVIRCQDLGQNPKLATRALDVTILDLNDNSPVFDKETYNVEIEENSRTNLFVTQVQASDLDKDQNAKVQYSITAGDHEIFDIDQSSGVITTKEPIDFETQDKLEVLVSAIDGGNPRRSGTATLVVQVTNVDDESPKFVQSHYAFEVLLNEPPGTAIGKVNAKDADGPPFDKFMYSISFNHNFLHVDPYEGLILLKKSPPQHPAKYHLQIFAKSDGIPTKTGTTNVTVSIIETRNSTDSSFLSLTNKQNIMMIIGIAVGSTICIIVLVVGIAVVLYRSRRAKAGSDSLVSSKENQKTRYSVSVEHKKESLDDSDEVFSDALPPGGILVDRDEVNSGSMDSGRGSHNSQDATQMKQSKNIAPIINVTKSRPSIQNINNLNKTTKQTNKNVKLPRNAETKKSAMPSNAGTLPMAPARELYQGISRTKIYYIQGEGVPPQAVSTPKLNTSRNNLSGSFNDVSNNDSGPEGVLNHYGGLNSLNTPNKSILKRNISSSEHDLTLGSNYSGNNGPEVMAKRPQNTSMWNKEFVDIEGAPGSIAIV